MKKYTLHLILLLVISGSFLFYSACKVNVSVNINLPITGTLWTLESIHYSETNVVTITETFTMAFSENGTFELVAACNVCGGNYEIVDNQSINFSDTMSCTEMDCGEESKDDEFHAALATADQYDSKETYLHLYFTPDSYLNFKK